VKDIRLSEYGRQPLQSGQPATEGVLRVTLKQVPGVVVHISQGKGSNLILRKEEGITKVGARLSALYGVPQQLLMALDKIVDRNDNSNFERGKKGGMTSIDGSLGLKDPQSRDQKLGSGLFCLVKKRKERDA